MNWKAKYSALLDAYTIDDAETGEMICTIDGEGRTERENKSIVKLIAAAPALKHALENLVKWESGTVNHIAAYKEAKKILEELK